MRETDVRECVGNFLRSTVHGVIVPASMGIGLTLVGCSGSSSSSRVDAAADVPGRMDATRDGNRDLSHEDGPIKLDTSIDSVVSRFDTPPVTPDAPVDAARDAAVDRQQARDTTRLDSAADRSTGRLDAPLDRAADRRDTAGDVAGSDGGDAD